METQNARFTGSIQKTVAYSYLLYLPAGYEPDGDQRWPLILTLHGVGERGTDLQLLKREGMPAFLEKQADFPFIVVAPQCMRGTAWMNEVDGLHALLESLAGQLNVDKKRIYATGYSMGGYGTWHLATHYPEDFAAIAPICGGGDPALAERIKDVPVWAFHGAKDSGVPLSESENMVEAVLKAGGQARLSVYPELGHDVWTATYQNPELYAWFLEHVKA